MANLANALRSNASSLTTTVAMTDQLRSLTHSQLASRVGGFVQELGQSPETVGILGENSVDWAVAFISATLAGKTVVPIPAFFSELQRAHLVRDAGIDRVILTDPESAAHAAGFPAVFSPSRQTGELFAGTSASGLIIYTSGSTGQPKGVKLASGQALWSAETLAEAISATSQDKYLSVLPLPMLLELICGVLIPTLVGGSVHYETSVAKSVGLGKMSNIAEAFERVRPTTSVLVPQLLALFCGQLAHSGKRASPDLRFIAVGGAHVPPALAASARQLGVPVFEGYGLSECASVVAVNRPEASREGTVGKPLRGLHVSNEDGEIVVEGPSVMDGYLHGGAAPLRLRTGDAGSLDAEGFLSVLGRLDNLIVTPYGRNISPEWMEAVIIGDPRIEACVLCLAGRPERLTVLLVPSRQGQSWFDAASSADLAAFVAEACKSAPDYARPQSIAILTPQQASAAALFTPTGRPRRREITKFLNDNADTLEIPQ